MSIQNYKMQSKYSENVLITKIVNISKVNLKDFLTKNIKMVISMVIWKNLLKNGTKTDSNILNNLVATSVPVKITVEVALLADIYTSPHVDF